MLIELNDRRGLPMAIIVEDIFSLQTMVEIDETKPQGPGNPPREWCRVHVYMRYDPWRWAYDVADDLSVVRQKVNRMLMTGESDDDAVAAHQLAEGEAARDEYFHRGQSILSPEALSEIARQHDEHRVELPESQPAEQELTSTGGPFPDSPESEGYAVAIPRAEAIGETDPKLDAALKEAARLQSADPFETAKTHRSTKVTKPKE